MTWIPSGPAMLFCPASRPERFAKADAAADVVILDLEDAVAREDKHAARAAVRDAQLDPLCTVVRVNALGSEAFDLDAEAVAGSGFRVVMLAKTESRAHVEEAARRTGADVIALVETPLGVLRAPEIAESPPCVGLMWGAEDLVAAMGGSSSRFSAREVTASTSMPAYREVPRHARAVVALAAAAHGRFAVDAVHVDIGDAEGLRAEALDAAALGFAATACIHPSQARVIREAYAPDAGQLLAAKRLLEAAARHQGAFEFEGQMVDAPVINQARAMVTRGR